jgi:hypothetical protein
MPHRFAACLAVLSLLAASPALAVNDNAGTTAFNFLKIGVGARPAALGGAYTAISGDLESTAWNPAGLLGIKERSAALSLSSYLVDTQAGFLSAAFPRGDRVWALSLNYFSYGNLSRTDEDGQELGSFAPFDMAAYLSVAQKIWNDRLTLGLNLKAVYSSIDDFTSDAYMVDVGLLSPGPFDGMTLGASISNLGAVRSGFTSASEESLPVNMRFGVSHRPAHAPLPLLLLADLNLPNDNDPYFAFGIELSLGNGLYLRPGYSTQQSGSQGDESLGLSAGAGLELKRYRFDYAYTSFPDLGDVHRVSLSGNF